jgi:sodium transport system permease protein
MKTIALKELVDALRDRRAVLSSAFYCLMGPAVVGMVALAMKGKGSEALIGMISVFTLVAAFSGGMNVAMDVIAGERERKSLAPLLSNPVTRLDVMIGKWLAVSAFAAGGVVLCLMGFAFVYPPGSIASLEVMLLTGLLPLALLAAAMELAVSTACRSSKEAQTYLSMVVFVPMVLGIFAVFFPGPLAGLRDVLPLAGQQLQIEAWLRGGPVAFMPSVVLGTLTCVCAAGIVLGAARVLESDDAVYGS